MKFLIVLACLVAAASASGLYGGYGHGAVLAHAPITSVTNRLDTYGKKNFFFYIFFK